MAFYQQSAQRRSRRCSEMKGRDEVVGPGNEDDKSHSPMQAPPRRRGAGNPPSR
jgi:hypothetical protein